MDDHKIDSIFSDSLKEDLRIAQRREPHHLPLRVVVDHIKLPRHDDSRTNRIGVNPSRRLNIGVGAGACHIKGKILPAELELPIDAHPDQNDDSHDAEDMPPQLQLSQYGYKAPPTLPPRGKLSQ